MFSFCDAALYTLNKSFKIMGKENVKNLHEMKSDQNGRIP